MPTGQWMPLMLNVEGSFLMLWLLPCQARAVAENKRLSSNLRSGAALVNESLGIIADALRPGDRDREADPPAPPPPITPPAVAAATAAPTPPVVSSGGATSRQPPGSPQNGQVAAQDTVAHPGTVTAVVVSAASAAASGVGSSGGFERPAGWPEEEPVGFRGGLLRNMDHG
jgi:hypothetical protein